MDEELKLFWKCITKSGGGGVRVVMNEELKLL